MLLLVILSSFVLCYGAVDKGRCITPANKEGQCIKVNQCAPLLELLQKSSRTDQEREYLRRSKCYENDPITVCCPLRECTMPDGLAGKCIQSHLCPSYVEDIKKDLTEEQMKYYVQAKCGDDPVTLCCVIEENKNASDNATAKPQRSENKCAEQLNAFPPDPKSKCCGYDATIGNKIIGGTTTYIDEYPWMALIQYNNTSRDKLSCGGVLISGKYVLTAAHCLDKIAVDLIGNPHLVRLGEYDISTDGPDCSEVEAGGLDCTPGEVRINVESWTVHPNYNIRTHKNDIGLIRLAEMAPFTDFIRPVCMPTSDISLKPPPEVRFSAVGWGLTETRSRSDIKLSVTLPYVELEACKIKYMDPKIKAELWDKQLCAGGENGKDTCKGDSGGPLLYENGTVYQVIGIVSFGPYPCAELNIPGVYTNVFAYKDWILNTITE